MENKGVFFEGIFKSSAVKPNSEAYYKLFVPKADTDVEYGMAFSHDGFNIQAAEAMMSLYEQGKAPLCVFLGVKPATLRATSEKGFDRWMRQDNYDIFDSAYPKFIVDELIPYVKEKYGLSISDSPDMHLALGGSSGGISSFNMAWFKPDYFHRVYTSSPSFLSMNNGRELPALVRKCETKPLRVWVEYSENEPDDYFGSSFAAAIDFIRALEFAGYDTDSSFFAEEGHCSRYHKVEAFEKAFEFLWKGWESEPIIVRCNSKRFEAIFPSDSSWENLDTVPVLPQKKQAVCNFAKGVYTAEGEKIYFEINGNRSIAANFGREISAIALSSDGWRLYVASKDLPCIYAMNIMPNGSLEGRYIHGALHRNTDFAYAGAADICVGEHDRIYAATELGVQCIRPFGLVDAIAPLPNGDAPLEVGVFNLGDGKMLVVRAENGAYVRKITEANGEIETGEPAPKEYYD